MQFYEKLVLKVWCKLIIMEKNRRVAKVKNSNKLESNTILFSIVHFQVLLRRAVNLINNSDVGYNSNGIIGLNGFQNILREKETKETLRKVGKGCRIGMDKGANILVSKLTKCPISCRRIGDIKVKINLYYSIEQISIFVKNVFI